MSKRKLFIGSSEEAFSIAQYVKTIIEDPKNNLNNIDAVLWKETDWGNLETALTSLNNNIDEYYYAIFIGFPDSELKETRPNPTSPGLMKTSEYYATRDNTIFEFGLFFSRLGKERTFFLNPKDIAGSFPFKILSDVGNSAYILNYEIEKISGNWKLKLFNPSDLIKFIIKEEKKMSDLNTNCRTELPRHAQEIESQLGNIGERDEFYLNKLKNGLDYLLYCKSTSTGISIQELTTDILNAIKDIKDFCKPEHLAKKQSHANGIRFVWVFSSKPFEFIHSSEEHIKKIKTAVLDNLKNGVRYTYFVSHSEFKLSDIDILIGDKTSSLRDNIEIIFVESKYFKTFFTLHFKEQLQLESVYMSSLLPHRNDLMIQVTDPDHIKRIKDRIQKMKGEDVTSDKIKTVDYTVH